MPIIKFFKNRTKKQKIIILIVAVIILVFSILKLYFPSFNFSSWTKTINSVSKIGNTNDAEEQPLSVHFIDVGQGDCIFVKGENGSILIDTGNPEDSTKISRYLLERNVTSLDYLILTHPHADHAGGAEGIISHIEVKSIIMPRVPDELVPTAMWYSNLVKAIKANNISVYAAHAGDEYSFSDASFTVLAPVNNSDDLNDMSVIIKLVYKNTSFLFTGDAGFDEEMSVLTSGVDVKSDVLKIGHHGSRYSTSDDFFAAVSPDVAVISCGKDNKYGHPNKEITELLRMNKTPYLRTDRNGTVVIGSDGEKLYCFFERGKVQ